LNPVGFLDLMRDRQSKTAIPSGIAVLLLRTGFSKASDSSAPNQRPVFDTHALTLVKRWRLVIREVTRLAAFQMHPHRIIGGAAQVFFDRIAAQATTQGAKDRHAGTTAPTSKLITDKTTRHRATHRTDAGSLAFMPDSRDRFYDSAA